MNAPPLDKRNPTTQQEFTIHAKINLKIIRNTTGIIRMGRLAGIMQPVITCG
jgi:hypothetical protein